MSAPSVARPTWDPHFSRFRRHTRAQREVLNRRRLPISPMYYLVATPLMLLDIYEELRTGHWYLQRVIE